MLADLKCVKINLKWRKRVLNLGSRRLACGLCVNGSTEGPIQGTLSLVWNMGRGLSFVSLLKFTKDSLYLHSLMQEDGKLTQIMPRVPGKMVRADVFLVTRASDNKPSSVLSFGKLSLKPSWTEASSQGERCPLSILPAAPRVNSRVWGRAILIPLESGCIRLHLSEVTFPLPLGWRLLMFNYSSISTLPVSPLSLLSQKQLDRENAAAWRNQG